MYHLPTPPPWRAPVEPGIQQTDEPAPDAQSWQLLMHRWDASDVYPSGHQLLEVVTGTEEDAMARLMEVATDRATHGYPSGYQIMQHGASIIVSSLPGGRWDYWYMAARIIARVPPTPKKTRRERKMEKKERKDNEYKPSI